MPLKEGDLWWHLRLGEQIADTQSIPQLDSFTFTAAGEPYYFGRAWLSDLVFYGLEQSGGLTALVLLQALAATAVVGIVLAETLARGVAPRLAGITALLAFAALSPFLSLRPQVFSFVCFGVMLWAISVWRRERRNRLWLLPLVMALWANLHAAWVLGVLLLAATCGLTLAEALLRRENLRSQMPLFLWSGVAVAALLVNPEGIQILRDPLAAGTNPVIQQFISEWQPPSFGMSYAWPFFLLILLLAAGFVFSRRRLGLYDTGLLLIFLLPSFRYVRMLPFFYLVAFPILGWLAAGLHFGSQPDNKALPRPGNARINLALLLTLVIVALLSIPTVRLAMTGQPESSLVSEYFPDTASDFLDTLPGSDLRFFSMPEWGGYLIWRHFPRARVMVDGRVELFPTEVWADYLTIANLGQGWQELLKTYQVDYLVLNRRQQSRLIQDVIDAGMICPFQDERFVVCRGPDQ